MPKTRIDENGRVCTKCHIYHQWADFQLSKTGINGRNPQCKACTNRSEYLPNPSIAYREIKRREEPKSEYWRSEGEIRETYYRPISGISFSKNTQSSF